MYLQKLEIKDSPTSDKSYMVSVCENVEKDANLDIF